MGEESDGLLRSRKANPELRTKKPDRLKPVLHNGDGWFENRD